MKIVAIIPARGGSKRVPGKNVYPVAGKPLITHSVEHAKQSKRVNRVIVSTDDAEIANVSRAAGAEVIERPASLGGDKASSESALVHVLDTLKQKEAYTPDLVVFLQCTSPVRDPEDIDRAIAELEKQNADSLLSACHNDKFLWRVVEGQPKALNYDPAHRPREQDFGKEYRENGSIYLFKPWVLEKFNNRLGGKSAIYEMPFWSSFQVDSIEDLELVDWILRTRKPARG